MLRIRCAGRNPGPLQQVERGRHAEHQHGHDQGKTEIGQRPGQGHAPLHFAGAGVLRALRVGVGHQAANGQQQDISQLQAVIGGHDHARHFAHGHRAQQHQPQAHAAKHGEMGALGVGHTDAEQQDEEGVNAQLHTHPSP